MQQNQHPAGSGTPKGTKPELSSFQELSQSYDQITNIHFRVLQSEQ